MTEAEVEVAINTVDGLWRIRVAASIDSGKAYFAIGSPMGSAGMYMTPAQLEELSTSLATLAFELRMEGT